MSAPHVSFLSRGTRWFVYLFLAAFIVCGAAAIEAWPLTGWRLFSHVRARHQVSWEVDGVDAAKIERPLPFDRFPVSYRGFVHVLDGFAGRTQNQQIETCRAWMNQASSVGAAVQALAIYRVDTDEGMRRGDHAAPGIRTLFFRCDQTTVTPLPQVEDGGAPE